MRHEYSPQHILLRYPSGSEYVFYWNSELTQLIPAGNNGDRLYPKSYPPQTGSPEGYTLVTSSGEEFDFRRVASTDGFQLLQKRNGRGYSWTLTYSSNGANGRLTKIENNFHRWIQITSETVNDISRIAQVSTSDGRNVFYHYSGWPNSSSR